MSARARAPFRLRNLVALIIGTAFLIGTAVVLGDYVQRFGFDGAAGFGVVVAVAATWLLARAMSGSSYRPGALAAAARSVVFLLSLVGPVVLVILAYVPVFRHAHSTNPDRALLAGAGVLLIGVFGCATLGGRGAIKDPAGPGGRRP
jgi:drug/metabolite transporter (DMT)-like permease